MLTEPRPEIPHDVFTAFNTLLVQKDVATKLICEFRIDLVLYVARADGSLKGPHMRFERVVIADDWHVVGQRHLLLNRMSMRTTGASLVLKHNYRNLTASGRFQQPETLERTVTGGCACELRMSITAGRNT